VALAWPVISCARLGHHNECLLVLKQAQRWRFSSDNPNQNRKARALQEISAAEKASGEAGLFWRIEQIAVGETEPIIGRSEEEICLMRLREKQALES
jgi:hypothetical protein